MFPKCWQAKHRKNDRSNPTPLNPTPATCHKRKRKLRCNFRKVALQKLHCNIRFSAVRTSFYQKLRCAGEKRQRFIEKLCCKKTAFSCRFPAHFRLPRLGSHIWGLLKTEGEQNVACHLGGGQTYYRARPQKPSFGGHKVGLVWSVPFPSHFAHIHPPLLTTFLKTDAPICKNLTRHFLKTFL